MFLVKVRTPFFEHSLLAADAREGLKSMWAFAAHNFEVAVLNESGFELSIAQLEALEATRQVPGGSKWDTSGREDA